MSKAPATRIPCGFTVLVDSREQQSYDFLNIHANADKGHALLYIPTMRVGLPNGDYSLMGYPQVCVERKSAADLYASVARRANFVARLERMAELVSGPAAGYAAVVVEAERMDLLRNPPAFSRYHPRALSRTLISWDVRYPVRWHFMRDRGSAEVLTYRLLEAFYRQHKEEGEVT